MVSFRSRRDDWSAMANDKAVNDIHKGLNQKIGLPKNDRFYKCGPEGAQD